MRRSPFAFRSMVVVAALTTGSWSVTAAGQESERVGSGSVAQAPDPAAPATGSAATSAPTAGAGGAQLAAPAAGSGAVAFDASGAQPPVEAVPPTSQLRAIDPEPRPTQNPPTTGIHFDAEPVRDIAILGIAVGFTACLQLINSTGEIRPQQIAANFQHNQLLKIDRGAVSQDIDPDAGMYSNIGIGIALGYAALDPVLSGIREKSVQTAIVDAFMYAESLAITQGITNLAKIAVRRPRPIAYKEFEANRDNPNYSNTETDSAVSFFSGHAATAASMAATATYLAFARSPGTIRPWLTLLLGSAVTTFVSYERVRAGKHFPTDVIAGAFAGAGVGVLVPHFHRHDTEKQRPMWVGFAPAREGRGGTLSLSGFF